MKKNKYHRIILGLLIAFLISFSKSVYSQSGDMWVVTGGDSHANIIMTNQVTGEVISTFCIDAHLDLPWMGDVFYMDPSGEYMVPVDAELQRMYIHRKSCDYEKPVLDIPSNCTGTTNIVTATCALGTPKWYRYLGSIDLDNPDHVGSSVTINSTGPSSQWYVMCANEDNSCKSDIVSLGKLGGLDSSGHPSNVRASDSVICVGDQTELLSDGCVANIYGSLYNVKWFTDSGLTSDVGGNIVSPTSSTTYYAACVDAFGCISGTSRNVMIEVNQIPTITAGTPVCAPDGLTYSVTFTIPTGAELTTTTAGTISGNTVSGIPAGTSATVTVESEEGCENTITTVSHDCTIPCNAPTPVVAEVERCGDGQVTLTATGCSGIYSYLWSNAATTASITVNVTASTPAYSVQCVETSRPTVCASAAVEAIVTINPIPTITAGTPVCAPDGLTYSVTFTIPAGAELTTTTAGTISGNTVSGIPAGTSATVTVESAEGCENTITTVSHDCTIPCNAPTPVVAEVERCGDGEVIITATGCSGIYSYLWSNAAITASITVNVTTSTPAYTVQCVETSRPTICASAAVEAVVTINPIPTITTGTPVCAPDGLTYSVTFTIPAGAELTTTTAGTISGNTVSGIPAGTSATVTVESAEGCENTLTTVSHDCTTPVFDLALTKTMAVGSKTIYKVGDLVTFDITVFNQGTVTATSVDLVDYIPTGLTFQTGSDWTLDGDKARWTGAITNLAPGAQQTVQISFIVNASATGIIINTAEISGATNPENLEDIDSTPDDDKNNDGPVKNDVIDEDGKNVPGEDEDDHDIESITICLDAKCISAKSVRSK
jgi:uncharacterized repeat protein (TIGR01451 family)